MFNIDSFLERFKKINIPDEEARNSLSIIISSEIGVTVDIKNISIRNNVAYIKTDSSTKSEIFIKKQKILKNLQEKGGEKNIVLDIR